MERCQCEFLCPVPDPVYHGLSSVVWVGVVYQRSERGLPSYGVSEPPGRRERGHHMDTFFTCDIKVKRCN